METNTTSTIRQLVLPIALIFGIGRIILDVIPKLAGANSKIYYSTYLIAFVLETLVIIYLINNYKKSQSGELTLSEALLIGVMFMAVVGSLFAIQSYIFDSYIDANYQKNAALEWANLYGKGDEVKKMINEGEGMQQTSSIFSIFTSVLKFSLLGILVSFIVGSISRNR